MADKSGSSQPVILVTAGYDHTIRFWEALSGVCYRTVQHPDSQVNSLQITPDKLYVAAAGNPHVRLYDVSSNNPNPVTSFDGHTGNVTSCGFQKRSEWMYTGSEDGTVKIWDLRAPGCQRDYEHRASVNCVALHPNQGELISGDQNGRIKIWDLKANVCTEQLIPEGDSAIRSITIASDGSLLCAANNSGNVYLWKLERNVGSTALSIQPLEKIEAHKNYVLKCLLSSDCSLLATTSADTSIKLWNTSDFSLVKQLSGHSRWVWDCAFSADAAYLVTASSDHCARLWDLAQGETIRKYQGHQKPVVCLALNDIAGPSDNEQ